MKWTDDNKRQGRDGNVFYDKNQGPMSPFFARYIIGVTLILATCAGWWWVAS